MSRRDKILRIYVWSCLSVNIWFSGFFSGIHLFFAAMMSGIFAVFFAFYIITKLQRQLIIVNHKPILVSKPRVIIDAEFEEV